MYMSLNDARQQGARGECELTVCGRVRALRTHGRITFVDLIHNAERLQVVWNTGDCPWALGEMIEAQGTMRATRAGEMSLWCLSARSLCVPERPLEGAPLEGRAPEQRFLTDPQTLDVMRRRGRLTRAVREHLWGAGLPANS